MRYSLLNHSVVPDTSGNCYPSMAIAEGFTYNIGQCWVFKDAGDGFLNGIFETPKSLTGLTLTLKIIWTANATANNCNWNFRYKAIGGNDTTVLDVDVSSSPTEADVDQTDAAPSTAKERLNLSIALTASNWAADTSIVWQLWRNGDAAGDTMAASALLLDLLLDDGV